MQVFNPIAANQISPVAYAQKELSAKWGEVNGMRVALELAAPAVEKARKDVLGVTDVSCFQRYGVKGPQAAQWLVEQALAIPSAPNSWTLSEKKSLVLRLGSSEFLVEDQPGGSACQILNANKKAVAGICKVQRADASFVLSGSEVLNLLSELCLLDLRDKALPANGLVMTQVAGISATVLRQQLDGQQIYRLWCDGTYGAYMWDVLLEIAEELGGGAVGLSSHFKGVL